MFCRALDEAFGTISARLKIKARFIAMSAPKRPKTSYPPLRLVSFTSKGGTCRVGVQCSSTSRVVDVCAVDPTIPADMRTFLEAGESAMEAATKAFQSVDISSSSDNVFGPNEYNLKAPISNPEKILCVGMNYVDHCTEQNIPVPTEPIIFSKFSSAITDPCAPVVKSEETEQLDYEVELTIVIGKEGKKIKEEDAMSYVAGYTVAHDVSARDWQLHKNGGQWLLGKTFDTFCPLGPVIVTPSALSDPHNLAIRCKLNGEIVQDSNTNQLVHKTEALIAFISRFVTLKPGDVILTGTPPGVGCFKKPPLWLKKGDVVECEIAEIGTIRNEIQ